MIESMEPVNAFEAPGPFALSEQERTSVLWGKLMAHYRERLAKLRSQNDGELSVDRTAKLRGQIAEVKAFLHLDEDQTLIRDQLTAHCAVPQRTVRG